MEERELRKKFKSKICLQILEDQIEYNDRFMADKCIKILKFVDVLRRL